MTTHHREPGLGRTPAAPDRSLLRPLSEGAAGRGRPASSSLACVAHADRDRLLRLSVQLDAMASGALGLLAAVAAPVLDDLLGIPVAVLVALGLLLVAWGAALWFVATRTRVARPAVWAVIVVNLLWVAGSFAVVAAGWLSLTAVGFALVLAQAAAVVFIADLQFLGLRRAWRPAGASAG